MVISKAEGTGEDKVCQSHICQAWDGSSPFTDLHLPRARIRDKPGHLPSVALRSSLELLASLAGTLPQPLRLFSEPNCSQETR